MGVKIMLHEIIKTERNNKHISQSALAKIIGVAQQTIGSWETGRTSPDTEMLKKLADYFEVSIDYLLGKTNFRNHIETIALHRVGDPKDDLPQEALDKNEEFKELMRLKYQKKPTSK